MKEMTENINTNILDVGDSAPSGTPRPQGVVSNTMWRNVRELRPRPSLIPSREVRLGNARIFIDEDPRTAQAIEALNRKGCRFLLTPEDTRGRSLRPLSPGHEGAERLQVFWEGAMGLGLKTLSPIPSLGVVGKYTGRQVWEMERQASNSLYIMDTGVGGVFLDAESGGNLTRLINHHCPLYFYILKFFVFTFFTLLFFVLCYSFSIYPGFQISKLLISISCALVLDLRNISC